MKNIILLLSIFLTIANCSLQKPIKHHGVHKLELKQKKLIVNVTNKNDIIKILGPPSVQSRFDTELLFFIERKITNTSSLKLGKQIIMTNNVLIVELDSYGILEKKVFYDLTKMNALKFSKNTTDIDYSKQSFVYDFLSSMRQKINDPLGKRRKK
jgi:outer membrane protein assembly factor BamE (lipoprotein component of BamABCDE complex)|tara:strand:+ start:176 stop:640 length:465 start_codon:yes stop_codon:yes gene_type:complete